MGAMSKYFGGSLPAGHVKPILLPSSGIHTDPDGSKWLSSGAVVPALQADPYLIDTDLRCVKATLDINLPVTLTAAARFANTSAVTWIIDASGAVLYSSDGGLAWNNTAPSGGGSITSIIGFRDLGTGIEVFAASSTNLFRAVITNAAPGTVAWSSVAAISNTSGFSGGASFAFDGTAYLICWPSSTPGYVTSLASTNGASWSESSRIAVDASVGYKCLVCAKPGGGFRVALTSNSSSSYFNVYSTADGTAFAKLNAAILQLTTPLVAEKMLLTYMGARLFLFANTSAQSIGQVSLFSDDDGVTWYALAAKLNLPIYAISSYGSGGAHYDGVRLAYVSWGSNAAHLISTANGIDFKITQIFYDNSEINAFTIGQLIGERFVFVPNNSTKNKLFQIKNSFTPSVATDFVGVAVRSVPYGSSSLIFAARVL